MQLPRLEVKDTLGRRVVPMDKAQFTIGRRSACDLQVVDSDVSRDHAEIVRDGGRYIVRDTSSRFGTFVNDVPVTERPLRHGDCIRLGRPGSAEVVFLVDTETSAGLELSSISRGASSGAQGSLRLVSALLEGLRALGSGHVLDDVLALVLDAAIEIAGAERGFLLLATPEGALEFTLARAQGRVTLPGRAFEASRKIPQEVFLTGTSQVLSDLRDDAVADMHAGTIAMGIRHVLCAPLRLVQYLDRPGDAPEQKRIGVLYLDSRDRGTLLAPQTREAVETLATEAAVAIENARLYREALEKATLDQELSVASEIQQALLPTSPHVRGKITMVGSSVACRSIGGDFYEYLDLSDGLVGFALGDVSGKGPAAALLAASLQSLLVAYASTEPTAAATLTRVNTAMLRRAVEGRFATLMYGTLTAAGRLTYCNAGHNPPMLFTRHGVRRLERGGLFVGAFPKASYEEETIQLEPGDTLVIFSDGVSEAMNTGGEEFGDEGIAACIAAELAREPQGVLDHLLSGVQAFSLGTIQRDDVTALVVRYA